MTKNKIRSIIDLVNHGWRAYHAAPNSAIYAKINCPYAPEKDENGKKKRKGKEPFWFVRSDSFVCVGCDKQCALFRPEGFILPLPINYEEKSGEPFTLTPAEMVQRKSLLRVDEAAYCLNIKERTVYDWIAEGKLRKTVDNPVRVPAEDVSFHMNNFEA
ncbi:MAG: hypothetical protein DELT_02540 [Desulfovibrio sp.]